MKTDRRTKKQTVFHLEWRYRRERNGRFFRLGCADSLADAKDTIRREAQDPFTPIAEARVVRESPEGVAEVYRWKDKAKKRG